VRVIHSLEVLVHSVKDNFLGIFLVEIRLAAFEALYAVMKSGIAWVKLKRFNRLDHWFLPSAVVNVVIAVQHVVGGDSSENILMIGAWFRKKFFSLLNDQIFGLNRK